MNIFDTDPNPYFKPNIVFRDCICCGRPFYAVNRQKYCNKSHNGKPCSIEAWMKTRQRRRNSGRRSVRFRVLARYKFTCQYCGRKAPDVVLHVDHIVPVSRGGADDESNLTVACKDCNLGKKDILLAA